MRRGWMFVLPLLAAGCDSGRNDVERPPPPVNVQPTCPDGHRLIGGVCTLDPCPQGLTRDAANGSCVEVEALVASSRPLVPSPSANVTNDAARPNDFLILDDRRLRYAPRVRKLLIVEISNVERLYKQSDRLSKDRPRLMARLGDGYSELAASAAVDAETAAHPKERKKSKLIVKAARKNAIKYYKKLLKQYPQFCRNASNGCTDATLHYLAFELVLGGDLMKARKAWLELVKNHPQSDRVAAAHIGFGHLFEAEAQANPSKWPVAQKFYEEAAKQPPNRLTGVAWYRLGRVRVQTGDQAGANNAFQNARDFISANPDTAAADALRTAEGS